MRWLSARVSTKSSAEVSEKMSDGPAYLGVEARPLLTVRRGDVKLGVACSNALRSSSLVILRVCLMGVGVGSSTSVLAGVRGFSTPVVVVVMVNIALSDF